MRESSPVRFSILLLLALLALLIAAPLRGQGTCLPTSERLCLEEGRFAVEATWRDAQGLTGQGQVVFLSSEDSGLFWFFDARNWEVLVKVLNGCSLNDRFWVFAAATTDVEYTLEVTDTLAGVTTTYTNPLGTRADAVTDTDAFATCTPEDRLAPPSPATAPAKLAVPPALRMLPKQTVGPCFPGPTNFCLSDDRFQVEVDWRDFTGNTGHASVVPVSTEDSGLFYFFNEDNWEMLVKVLDGCGLNDRFWVFAAATTNVEYTLEVTDTWTGLVQRYENPLGVSSPAITDTNAFATCDAVMTEEPTIRFLSDRSVILGGARTEAVLEVEVIDGEGLPVPGAEVTWTSAAPELVGVEAISPTRARVQAVGAAPGFSEITARFGDATARATVLLAVPGPMTVLIDSRLVRERRRGEVVLERTPETELLMPGQILVSGDGAGLLDRILSLTIAGDLVRADLEPSSLPEAFESLEVDVVGEPIEIKVLMAEDGNTVEVYDARGALIEKTFLDRIRCETESGTTAGVQVRGGSVRLVYRLRPEASLRTSFFSLQLFRLGLRGTVRLTAATGSVTFNTNIGGEITCSLDLGQLATPKLPVSVFSIGLNFTPVVGVKASAMFNGPSLKITGPHGFAAGQARAGIQYTPGGGWQTLASRSWSGELTPLAVDLKPDFEFEASAGPFGQLDIGLAIDLGRGFFSFELADLRFAELIGSGEINLAIRSPLDFRQPAYKGPEWDLGLALEGNLKAELAGGALADFLDYLDIDTSFGGSLQLFRLELPLAASPAPESLEVQAPRTSCAGGLPEVRVGETVRFVTRDPDADRDVSGLASFLGSIEGRAPLATRTRGRFRDRRGEGAWSPLMPGLYRVYPRLAVDVISRVPRLPYGGGPNVFGELLVAAPDGVPVIDGIVPNPLVLVTEVPGDVTVSFHDGDAGINLISFEVVEVDCPLGCEIDSSSFDPGVVEATVGSFTFTTHCTNGTGLVNTVTFDVRLHDCQGNTSEPVRLPFECLPEGFDTVLGGDGVTSRFIVRPEAAAGAP